MLCRPLARIALGALLVAAPGAWLATRARAQEAPAPEPTPSPETDLEQETGYIEMPAPTDGSYVLGSSVGSGHNFGRPEFIRFLLMVAREWHRRHPDLPKICIGDMSHKDASDFPPHKTHKDGLTADIVTKPVNICNIKYENKDHQVELAELFQAYGARQILFNGDEVVAKIKIAQKHELHDDHYHVVIDPKRVPDDGKPVLVPAADLAQGASFGGAELDRAGKGLKLAWWLFGGAADHVKTVHAWFAEAGESGAELWDSGPQKPPRDPWLKLPVPVEDGKSYRWRLELELASGATASFDWQTVKADLAPPTVTADEPADGATFTSGPRIAWRFEKPRAEQASFTIELSHDKSGKGATAIGPIASKETSFALAATAFERERRAWWRVRARDARGNEGASEWRSFKPASNYRFVPPQGTTKGACKLLSRDDGTTVVAKLKKGEAVVVLGEIDTRYLVAPLSGKVAGFVSRDAIAVRDTTPGVR